MAKVGPFIRDPKAGSYCQITLDSGEKISSTTTSRASPSSARSCSDSAPTSSFGVIWTSPQGRTALATHA